MKHKLKEVCGESAFTSVAEVAELKTMKCELKVKLHQAKRVTENSCRVKNDEV
jgi:hypothetical protein